MKNNPWFGLLGYLLWPICAIVYYLGENMWFSGFFAGGFVTITSFIWCHIREKKNNK